MHSQSHRVHISLTIASSHKGWVPLRSSHTFRRRIHHSRELLCFSRPIRSAGLGRRSKVSSLKLQLQRVNPDRCTRCLDAHTDSLLIQMLFLSWSPFCGQLRRSGICLQLRSCPILPLALHRRNCFSDVRRSGVPCSANAYRRTTIGLW